MIEITMVDGGSLRAAPFKSTFILKPDQKVLAESMLTHGFLSPIVVQKKSSTIIDGHERWMIAGNSEPLIKRYGGRVPVTFIDCDDIDAMLLHIQMNRGRGVLYAKPLSSMFKKIVRSGKYAKQDLRRLLSMSADEIDLLFDGGLIKTRKLKDHVYSRAWIPVEAPSTKNGKSTPAVTIERPPNADR
jgi:ParB-like chromosome segregation protein Spo0J